MEKQQFKSQLIKKKVVYNFRENDIKSNGNGAPLAPIYHYAIAKKMNITAIEDLGRPEVVKAMDSDGNGKGEFWIGADGWASANVNQVKLRDYKLYDAGIEPIRAAEAVKNARVLDSIK